MDRSWQHWSLHNGCSFKWRGAARLPTNPDFILSCFHNGLLFLFIYSLQSSEFGWKCWYRQRQVSNYFDFAWSSSGLFIYLYYVCSIVNIKNILVAVLTQHFWMMRNVTCFIFTINPLDWYLQHVSSVKKLISFIRFGFKSIHLTKDWKSVGCRNCNNGVSTLHLGVIDFVPVSRAHRRHKISPCVRIAPPFPPCPFETPPMEQNTATWVHSTLPHFD